MQEKDKQAGLRAAAAERRLIIQMQIEEKKRRRARDRQATLMDHRAMLRTEEEYTVKVNKLLAEERAKMQLYRKGGQ